jgi:MoxR-like ATPase
VIHFYVRRDSVSNSNVQRLPAEQLFSAELICLIAHDTHPKPKGWQLSPHMVRTFILGSGKKEIGGLIIQRKIFGNDDVVERSIVTLIGQRGLMLVGEPGTAKSMLSELLAAAISGISTHTVQGSAGIVEENIRYSWNYALLLKSGPSLDALVSGPLYESMSSGQLMRFEEITRCPIEVQDNLIPVLSDRILHIPELKDESTRFLLSQPGFNIIATANLKDRGVNEMSSALKRRFNFETMRPLAKQQDQADLIHREVNKQLKDDNITLDLEHDVADLLAKVFYEMRNGTVDGSAIDCPTTVLSTAEAISVAYSAAIQCHYFGEAVLTPNHLRQYMIGTVIKDDDDDVKRFEEYLRIVKRKRKDQPLWQSFCGE